MKKKYDSENRVITEEMMKNTDKRAAFAGFYTNAEDYVESLLKRTGMSAQERRTAVPSIISYVCEYTDMREKLRADPKKTLKEAVKKLDGVNTQQAAQILDRAVFALDIVSSKASGDILCMLRGKDIETLYLKASSEKGYYWSDNEAKLRERLLNDFRVDDLGRHPELIGTLNSFISENTDIKADCDALGIEGNELRYAAIVEIWSKNKDKLSLRDSAYLGCACIDIQAASDAVQREYLSQKQYEDFQYIITLAVILIGIKLCIDVGMLVMALALALVSIFIIVYYIRHAFDFSEVMRDPDYASILKRFGLGDTGKSGGEYVSSDNKELQPV